MAKSNQNEIGELILSGFKTYYKGTVIKTVWYSHKDRHIDQSHREFRNKPSHLQSTGFDKGAKTIQRERTVFSTNGTTRYLHVKLIWQKNLV